MTVQFKNISPQDQSVLFQVPEVILTQNVLLSLPIPTIGALSLTCKKLKILCSKTELFQMLLSKHFIEKGEKNVSAEEAYTTLQNRYTIHCNIKNGIYEMLHLSDMGAVRFVKVYKDRLLVMADEKSKIFDVNTGKCLITFKRDQIWATADTVMMGDFFFAASSECTCKMWNMLNGEMIRSFKGHTETVYHLQIYKDKFVTGSSDKTCRIWDINTGKCLAVLEGHPYGISCLDVSENIVVAASFDVGICSYHKITGWDFSGKCLYSLEGSNAIAGIKIVGEKFFAIGSSYGPVCQMIDLKTGKSLKSLWKNTGSGNCMEFFEGKIIIGTYKVCHIWDPIDETVHTLKGGHGPIEALKIFDRKLFCGCADGTCPVWDLDTLACLNTFSEHNWDHFSQVSSVEYSDGKLISGSWDKSVIIRNFKLGCLKKINSHEVLRQLFTHLQEIQKFNQPFIDFTHFINTFRKMPLNIKKEFLTCFFYEVIRAFPPKESIGSELPKNACAEANGVLCGLNEGQKIEPQLVNVLCQALHNFLTEHDKKKTSCE